MTTTTPPVDPVPTPDPGPDPVPDAGPGPGPGPDPGLDPDLSADPDPNPGRPPGVAPDPDPDRPLGPVPVSVCPLAGEVVLPGETVPVTVVHARQSIGAAFADGHVALLDDRALLAVTEQAFRLVAQTQALAAQLLAEVDGRDAAERICKLSTAHWLHQTTLTSTLRVCRGQTRHATRTFADYPEVAAAQARGEISHDQARAIVTGLHQLSPDLDSAKRAAAMDELLDRARQFDPGELTTVAERLLHHVDPDRADELDAKRLEDQRRRAERGRHLVLYPDGHGSWIIKGKLPDVVGEHVATVLNALTDQHCQAAREAAKAGAGDVEDALADPHQVRADVLADIITAYTATGTAPTHGGDRPRITLTIRWEDLLAAVGHATTEQGQGLDPATVRRMACDADLLPAVLNSAGVPLDVGRVRRSIPTGLRAGLWLRDGGCAFPGCDRPPRECECHHIVPWLIGGITALPNLVLLCPHHHARVEPATNPHTGQVIENPYRWEVRLNGAGLPEFLPPRTHDYQRTPRMHTRYTIATYNR